MNPQSHVSFNKVFFEKKHSSLHANICGMDSLTPSGTYFFFWFSLFKIWDWRLFPQQEVGEGWQWGLILWQFQHLKRWLLFKNRSIYCHITSNRVIRPVKLNKLSFSSNEINKQFPDPVYSVAGQIQVWMPGYTYIREQYHQHK